MAHDVCGNRFWAANIFQMCNQGSTKTVKVSFRSKSSFVFKLSKPVANAAPTFSIFSPSYQVLSDCWVCRNYSVPFFLFLTREYDGLAVVAVSKVTNSVQPCTSMSGDPDGMLQPVTILAQSFIHLLGFFVCPGSLCNGSRFGKFMILPDAWVFVETLPKIYVRRLPFLHRCAGHTMFVANVAEKDFAFLPA